MENVSKVREKEKKRTKECSIRMHLSLRMTCVPLGIVHNLIVHFFFNCTLLFKSAMVT